MKRIKRKTIENVGVFEYYLTKTLNETEDGMITTYGIAIKDVNEDYIEEINNIWTEKEVVLDFINLIAENQVTCTHLFELCEEFTEELYSI